MRAQYLPQRCLQQMSPSMIAPYRIPPVAIHDRRDPIAHGEILLQQSLVRAHTLHRQHAAGNLRNGSVPVRSQEDAGIAHLPA